MESRSSKNIVKATNVNGQSPFNYGRHRYFKSEVWALRRHCSGVFFLVQNITALVERKRRITRRTISVTVSALKSKLPETWFRSNAKPVIAMSLPGHVNQRKLGESFFTTDARDPFSGWTSSLERCYLHSRSASDKVCMLR